MDLIEDSNRCDKCNKSYSRLSSLLKHSVVCGKRYHCDYCEYKTPLKGNLIPHIQARHLPPDPNRNRCNKCSYNFRHPSSLIKHLKICGVKDFATLSKLKRYSCEHCDYKTRDKSSLIGHMLVKHLPNDPELNKCGKCGKVYSCLSLLRKHAKFCSLSKDEKLSVYHLSCHHCDYRTYKKSSLINHILRNHVPRKTSLAYFQRFTCDYCNKKTSSKRNMLDHIKSKHLPPDPDFNKCKKCGKNFNLRSSLQRHFKLCGKSKEYKRSLLQHSCNFCDFKTSSRSQLDLHHQRKHALRNSNRQGRPRKDKNYHDKKSEDEPYNVHMTPDERKSLTLTKRVSLRLREKPIVIY